ncbi:UNVERIFIED_CONTAM: Farnesyl pyrophosphate synthase [Sesamum calycinum]|uniref:Farnesyl pyrophosphate synthase n=1 Tax=Sesamum calycinum TaxID=2727403 RepID=A0AAW2MDL0_9LAMI
MTDLKSRFLQVYSVLKSELLNDPDFEFTDDSRHWVERMLDYNVLGGKLNRGLSVVDSYKLLKLGKELTDDEMFLACSLGWCIEWLQAYFLVLDDIMDGSHTRRGQPCWFRMPKDAYLEYEQTSYEKITNSIEAHPSKAVQAVLKSFLAKIYKRQK